MGQIIEGLSITVRASVPILKALGSRRRVWRRGGARLDFCFKKVPLAVC